MKKNVTWLIDEILLNKFKEDCDKKRLKYSNVIANLIEKYLEEQGG